MPLNQSASSNFVMLIINFVTVTNETCTFDWFDTYFGVFTGFYLHVLYVFRSLLSVSKSFFSDFSYLIIPVSFVNLFKRFIPMNYMYFACEIQIFFANSFHCFQRFRSDSMGLD